jgi:hypothetical protein
MRAQQRPRVLIWLIENRLLDEVAEKAGIIVTQDEVIAKFDQAVEMMLKTRGLTCEEFGEQTRRQYGQSSDEVRTQQLADPTWRQAVLHAKLLEHQFPEELTIPDEQIEKYYHDNLERTPEALAEAAYPVRNHLGMGRPSSEPVGPFAIAPADDDATFPRAFRASRGSAPRRASSTGTPRVRRAGLESPRSPVRNL